MELATPSVALPQVARDDNVVYIKVDDDVVYIAPQTVAELVAEKLRNRWNLQDERK